MGLRLEQQLNPTLMKNDILHNKINGVNHDTIVLNVLRSLEQKLEKEIAAKQSLIKWQQDELKRLQNDVLKKDHIIDEFDTRLMECRSNVEGYRQLINKLITDVDKLQQNVDWYKRTYESRSLFGVIKDKLKHLFS
jgi:peptidoglycan hydrolase CwlO-like protein